MRCPDCNKFVPYGEPEIEIQGEDIQGSTFTADVRIMLPCEECSTELKETTISVEAQIVHECKKRGRKKPAYTLGNVESESGDEMQGSKHFYFADLTVNLTCDHCGEEIELEAQALEQSSAFDELV